MSTKQKLTDSQQLLCSSLGLIDLLEDKIDTLRVLADRSPDRLKLFSETAEVPFSNTVEKLRESLKETNFIASELLRFFGVTDVYPSERKNKQSEINQGIKMKNYSGMKGTEFLKEELQKFYTFRDLANELGIQLSEDILEKTRELEIRSQK